MYCCLCATKMECYDDVNNIGLRADFFKCPSCGVKSEAIYTGNMDMSVKSVSFYYKPEIESK